MQKTIESIVMLLGGIGMKRLIILILILFIILSILGCGIPDLPGPIGIPGI
jgi:lipopolysaccharide export LptBFGC system permease protein LptF